MDSLAISGATSHTPDRSDELQPSKVTFRRRWIENVPNGRGVEFRFTGGSREINNGAGKLSAPARSCNLLLWLQRVSEQQAQTDWHLKIGFILLAVLLLLEAEPPCAAAPFPEGLLEFISADFWNTSMVALAMFSSSE